MNPVIRIGGRPAATPHGTWVIVVLVVLLGELPAQSETWTNQVGHVLTARLVAIEGGQVVLQPPTGRTRRVPLASLRPADQERARAQTATERVPSELRACLNQAEEDIGRAGRFLAAGRISPDEYTDRCRQITRRFESLGAEVLQHQGLPGNPALLARLRQRLDQAEVRERQRLD